jgi:tetrahydromethanopterin S-methyltransferase subunit G
MFGKTKDAIDDEFTGLFGDEEAADNEAQFDGVRDRLQQVEGQINSQFTSMAAYAQIAQEQIELARAESRADSERIESRVTQLIERERAERLGMPTPGIDPNAATAVERRLDALEEAVEVIKVGISDCLSRQKALADAITSLFQPAADTMTTLPPPNIDGPIGDLALNG